MRHGRPAVATASAARGSRGTPRSRARPLPEPAGTSANGTGPKASTRATSFIVPSPPQATTSPAPVGAGASRRLGGMARAGGDHDRGVEAASGQRRARRVDFSGTRRRRLDRRPRSD